MTGFSNECNCLNCLRKNNVFKFLKEEELQLFNENRYEAKYRAGELIAKQGSAITHLISFTSGLAKIYIEGLNNRNLIIKLLTPGEMAGGPGFTVDNKYHFSIMALEDSEACFISINSFQEVMKNNCEFTIQLHRQANTHTIRNFQKFISLTQKQMPGRIADVLLYLSNEVYNANPFKLTISRQDLADLTAMTKESAIRILKQFKDDGIITLENEVMTIKSMDQLERISITG